MKKTSLNFTIFLLIVLVQGQVLHAQTTTVMKERGLPKEEFVPTTEYGRLLVEADQPKVGLFHNSTNEYGPNTTKEEFRVLSEMKMVESKRIMQENDGAKTPNQYEESQPVTGVTNFNGTFMYYFPQQWGAYGDAFVTKDNDKFSKPKDYTGHAALGGENRSTTLEAGLGRNLGWEENKWFSPVNWHINMSTPGIHLYRALYKNGTWAQVGVKGASVTQYKRAHDYGQSKVGSPYNWTFQEWGDGFYCSELVAFAWRSVGIDIIPQYRTWNMIWPVDIYKSERTFTVRGYIL